MTDAGPLAALVATLASAADSVRGLENDLVSAAPDSRVQMSDLARLIEMVNQVSRAADGIEARALAAFARRDEVYDPENGLDDPDQVVRSAGFVHDDADLEVSHLIGITEGSASTRVRRSAALAARFPHTLRAVTAGHVELWQAHQIVEECSLLDDEEARAVDEWIAKRLKGINPTKIRAVARYAITRTNPDKLRQRAARSRRGRMLEVTPAHEPGLAQVYALIPSHQAAAIWEAASELGKQYQQLDPALTADQARADAFVDLLLADVDVRASLTLGMPVVTRAASAVGDAHPTDDAHDPASRGGCGARTDDGAPADTDPLDDRTNDSPPLDDPRDRFKECSEFSDDEPLDPDATSAGTDVEPIERDLCGPDEDYDGPGMRPDRIPPWMLDPDDTSELAAPIGGTGPMAGAFTSGVTVPKVGYIPADVIARLLERMDLGIARALIDANDGTLVETITDAYRPNRRMKHFVAVRDGQCRMFGCGRSAMSCDLDHAVPHDKGGPTSPMNLAGLCRHHHRAKQARHWLYHFDPATAEATWSNRRTGTVRSTHPQASLAAHGRKVDDAAQGAASESSPTLASGSTSGSSSRASSPRASTSPATSGDSSAADWRATTPGHLQFYTGIGPLPF